MCIAAAVAAAFNHWSESNFEKRAGTRINSPRFILRQNVCAVHGIRYAKRDNIEIEAGHTVECFCLWKLLWKRVSSKRGILLGFFFSFSLFPVVESRKSKSFSHTAYDDACEFTLQKW